MSEEKCNEDSCLIGIEPKAEETGEKTQTEETKEEVKEATAAEVEQPKKEEDEFPETAEIAGALGLMTAVCQISPEDVQDSCWQEIEPLEEGKKPPREIIKEYAKKHGTEELEKSLNVLKRLIEEAKKDATGETERG